MKTPHPTEGELAILRVLWGRQVPMTVREVHQVLTRTKKTAYTTVLKMLTIMAEKGLVRRKIDPGGQDGHDRDQDNGG